MSNVIVDLERRAVVLVHDLEEGISDATAIEEPVMRQVATFAAKIGLPQAAFTQHAAGWLFDLMNHAVESVAAPAGEPAPTGGTSVPPEGAGAAHAGAPPAGGAAPAAAAAAPPPAAEGAAAATASEAGTGAPHAEEPLKPRTEETVTPGYQLCPQCQGFREVFANGRMEECPTCHGAGEIPTPAGTTPPTAPAA